MEAILEVLLQIFLELALQVVFETIALLGIEWIFRIIKVNNSLNKSLVFMCFVLLGWGFGWLSILIIPQAIFRVYNLRVLGIIFIPIFVGLLTYSLSSARVKGRSEKIDLFYFSNFLNGWFFALAFALIRFKYAI